MHTGTLEFALAAGLALLLATTCVTDWRRRDIPNWLTATIAVSAPAYWWATGAVLWPDLAVQLAVACAIFGFGLLLFRFGAMGGGDVKLLTALALWLPGLSFLKLIVIMSLVGGVLTVVLLIHHRRQKRPGNPEIPYGIAIALGGLWVICERYLNHFA